MTCSWPCTDIIIIYLFPKISKIQKFRLEEKKLQLATLSLELGILREDRVFMCFAKEAWKFQNK